MKRPLTILNFHGVGPVTRTMDEGERDCWLDRDHFEAVLDAVAGLPQVQLTVDDGNASDVGFILPALVERHLTASFFVCSGRLDEPTFLSRSQVLELQTAGMSIGSHGVAHRPWRGLSLFDLLVELAESRRALEDFCQATVDTAACPFGSYDRRVLGALRNAGYRRVFTSDGGSAAVHAWVQPRLTLRRGMTPEFVSHYVRRGPGRFRQWSISARRFLKRWR